jgi:hypothetical protein
LNNSLNAGEVYKSDHDAKALFHDPNEGYYTYFDNQLFLGKTKKGCIRMDRPISGYQSHLRAECETPNFS